MQKILMVPARFLVAGLGLAAAGAALQVAIPEFLTPVAAIAILAAIVVMIRPVPLGWLRYRAVGLGLIFGALALLGLSANPNDKAPLNVASKTDVTAELTPKKEPALSRPKPAATKSKPDPFQDRSQQSVWIEVSKDAVRGRLKDSRSAQFRNVVFHAYQGSTPAASRSG